MKTEIKIVIADDHPIFRQGLRQIIELDPLLKVAGEAGDGETALEQIRSNKPQVAVLDVDMPQMNGFEVAQAVREERLPLEVIFLTMYKDERIFNRAMDLGVKGYILKDSAATEVVGGIKAVVAGQNYISPVLSTYLLNRSRRAAVLAEQKPELNKLTQTERRVLKLIAEYKTSKEIADELFVSTRTIDAHRANICQKLELHGSHALLKFALEHKSEF
jgi:DNA-binding NarL/FixJ family response regulator